MQSYFKRVHAQTPTRFWINNVTREQAKLAIENGAVGCTQNPSYTWKMLSSEAEKDYAVSILDTLLREEPDDNTVELKLQRELVKHIAQDYFYPVYESSHGRLGYVSIQGDPFHEDAETIIKWAVYNHEAADNIMAKVPVTKDGLIAITELAAKGIAINATEVMSVKQAVDACQAYEKGIKGLAHPAPMYYSHITGILDEYLAGYVKTHQIDICKDALWQAGIAAAKKTYQITKARFPECGFIGGGARGLHHFTEMVGADCVVTINWKGTADELIRQDPPVVCRFQQPTPYAVTEELLNKIPDYVKAYMEGSISAEEYEDFGPVVLFRSQFESAWKSAIEFIADRRNTIK